MEILCEEHNAIGFFTKYSRLWIDANRALDQEGLIKTHVEGSPLSFNQSLTEFDIQNRIRDVHHAYHKAISSWIRNRSTTPFLISLHSFTPIWNHNIRSMDIGVLFDRDETLAHVFTKLLRKEGFFVEENQPYSGKNGLIYSAHRHGTENNIPYIELEFNQSILSTPERIRFVAQKLSHVLDTIQAEFSEYLVPQSVYVSKS